MYDVVVIGAGPAGIMAAGVAGARGAKVLLLEKNQILGRKLSVSGNGRCNITQAEFDLRKLVLSYGKNGAFLFSAFNQFGPRQVINFFEDLGVRLKTEDDGRVFPVSDLAQEVNMALKDFLNIGNVEIKYNAIVKKISLKNKKIEGVILENGTEILGNNFIIATGGLSYPLTGSTGDAIEWANVINHEVATTMPALVPLKVQENWVKELQGLALDNVEFGVYQNKKKIVSKIGDMLLTHFGVSGPVVLNLSKYAIEAKNKGEVKLRINFVPELNREQLDKKLQVELKQNGRKLLKNYLAEFVPKRLVESLAGLAKISSEKQLADITREERLKLVDILNSLELTMAGNLGYNFAIATAGGISLKEVDPKTMQSKKIKNLYFAGECLDLDGPTGGYNLQVAWATGHLAGVSVEI